MYAGGAKSVKKCAEVEQLKALPVAAQNHRVAAAAQAFPHIYSCLFCRVLTHTLSLESTSNKQTEVIAREVYKRNKSRRRTSPDASVSLKSLHCRPAAMDNTLWHSSWSIHARDQVEIVCFVFRVSLCQITLVTLWLDMLIPFLLRMIRCRPCRTSSLFRFCASAVCVKHHTRGAKLTLLLAPWALT